MPALPPQRLPDPTPRPRRSLPALLCGLFMLACLLSPPTPARATDDGPQLTPAPAAPGQLAGDAQQMKKPRRTTLPSTQRADRCAQAEAAVIAPALPSARPRRTANTPVPAPGGRLLEHPPRPAVRSRAPPAVA